MVVRRLTIVTPATTTRITIAYKTATTNGAVQQLKTTAVHATVTPPMTVHKTAPTNGAVQPRKTCAALDSDPTNDCIQDCNGDGAGTATEDNCSCSTVGTMTAHKIVMALKMAPPPAMNAARVMLILLTTAYKTVMETGVVTPSMTTAACDADPSNDCVQDCNNGMGRNSN